MAVTKYEEHTEQVKRPIEYKCDVCHHTFALKDDYDKKYKYEVKDQMAVLKYWHPAGGWCERTECGEVHCCSSACLAIAIGRVPFNAEITIPVGGFFKRKLV